MPTDMRAVVASARHFILSDRRVTRHAQRTFAEFAQHADAAGIIRGVSMARVACALDSPRSSVVRSVALLATLGYWAIEREHCRDGSLGPNTYRLLSLPAVLPARRGAAMRRRVPTRSSKPPAPLPLAAWAGQDWDRGVVSKPETGVVSSSRQPEREIYQDRALSGPSRTSSTGKPVDDAASAKPLARIPTPDEVRQAFAEAGAVASRVEAPHPRSMSPKLYRLLRRRLAELGGLDRWRTIVLATWEANEWLNGTNDKGHVGHLWEILSDASWEKLMAGVYAPRLSYAERRARHYEALSRDGRDA